MSLAQGMNKTALHQEKRAIAALKRHVPALDLKRRGLTAALAAEARRGAVLVAQLQALELQVGERFPMLSHAGVPVERLLSTMTVDVGKERFLGVTLPRVESVTTAPLPIPRHVFPHWVEPLIALACEAAEMRVRIAVHLQRRAALSRAATKATQRLNLVEKILIPEAEGRVRAIEIRLADQERAQVMIAKMAKAKLAKAAP